MRSIRNRMLTFALFLLAISAPASVFGETSIDGPIVGHSEGNHRLDCTVIRPWGGDGRPADLSIAPYPVIGWANGWGQGNVLAVAVEIGEMGAASRR